MARGFLAFGLDPTIRPATRGGRSSGAHITITLHNGDLPDNVKFEGDLAVDTEAMGLSNKRDRLCVVQLSSGDGHAHLVQFKPGVYHAPNLIRLLANPKITKIFHFARFDVAIMKHYLGVLTAPIYCTRTASRLVRTYSDKHGFKDLVKEILGVDISKQQQSSDWGAATLTEEQKQYAANDVLHLHQLRARLNEMLAREGRTDLAQKCFDFIPARALLDLAGFEDEDLFAHA